MRLTRDHPRIVTAVYRAVCAQLAVRLREATARFVRFAYTRSMDEIAEGVERIRRACAGA